MATKYLADKMSVKMSEIEVVRSMLEALTDYQLRKLQKIIDDMITENLAENGAELCHEHDFGRGNLLKEFCISCKKKANLNGT